ncbi:MAG: hypothetical protein ACR2F1_15065 [Nitrososphaeraceae archaeon]
MNKSFIDNINPEITLRGSSRNAGVTFLSLGYVLNIRFSRSQLYYKCTNQEYKYYVTGPGYNEKSKTSDTITNCAHIIWMRM